METLLNVDLIKSVERGYRATIHLVTGESLHIKSSDRDVMEKIQAYRSGLSSPPKPKPEKKDKDKKVKKENKKSVGSKK